MVKFPDDWGSHEPLFALFDSQRVPVAENDRPLGSTPYYGANGVQGYIDGSTHQGEYVLVAEDGASDLSDYPVRFVSGNIWVNNHAHVLSGIETVSDTKYLSYAFKLVDFTSILVGGTRAKLNGKTLKEITFPVPQVPEQRAIAEVLSGFDEHLANLDELIAKKKNIRDGALDQLITGDTRISDSRDPWVQVSFDDSVTSKARIGWQGLKAEEYLPMGYSYLIGGTDFRSGTISLDNISFVDRKRFELDPFIQVESGDVLVTKDGTIGKVALVPELDKPATLNSGVFVFRPDENLRRDYLYWVLSSSVFTDFIEALSAGSTIKHLYQKDLKEFSFKIPSSLTEQRMIAESLFSMDEEIRMLKAERSKIESLKLGAMDDLLTGRVRLPVEEEEV